MFNLISGFLKTLGPEYYDIMILWKSNIYLKDNDNYLSENLWPVETMQKSTRYMLWLLKT